ncbi:MAG: ribose 5-phosphate isomerase B [Elusimicrobia bacterium]|nr:ribose 5-phosphate isomerase B [Elusimicrobiota bacterium]
MKIAVGSDHGGFARKADALDFLRSEGHRAFDMGTHSEDSVDYPDFALAVAKAVAGRKADRGVLLCGTGIGMAMAANKVPGIRAAVAWSVETARLASEHNKANVLCLGARQLDAGLIREMLKVWLSTPFGGGRHEKRVRKIMRMEKDRGRLSR